MKSLSHEPDSPTDQPPSKRRILSTSTTASPSTTTASPSTTTTHRATTAHSKGTPSKPPRRFVMRMTAGKRRGF
ncbi:hypothetical protein BJ508DRAFT_335788 [Ascobolus immersus RN42]|uniref:Uncharacterized protein n=1 Tax=Ascobolus immersus RN42 TaxID=1160509 RepID=A0A3N4HEV3_ASCIM|nr:hypothetical protein BJ508DRAFT_335788 [Ascobolus immersus RN42]